MNTLKEIGKFVGLGPGRPGLIGIPVMQEQQITMRSVGAIVPVLSINERTSMRAMIAGLQRLPPINLDVEAVGDRFGDIPFTPIFRIHPSNGVILETRITLFNNGPEQGGSKAVGNSGDFSPFTLSFVGIYFMQVTRTGITNTGIIILEKKFHVEGVLPEHPEPPQPSPSPPPPLTPTCSIAGDPDQPLAQGFTGMRIFGGRFIAGEVVEIIENGTVQTTTKADALGMYNAHLSFLKGHHTVHARGQMSGRISNDVGFTL